MKKASNKGLGFWETYIFSCSIIKGCKISLKALRLLLLNVENAENCTTVKRQSFPLMTSVVNVNKCATSDLLTFTKKKLFFSKIKFFSCPNFCLKNERKYPGTSFPQPAITCWKLAIETLEKGVKCVLLLLLLTLNRSSQKTERQSSLKIP